MKTRITSKLIAETYAKKGSNISATCLALGISRQTFYNWRAKNKALDEKLNDVFEAMVDNAESKLLRHINDGDTTCLMFFLKTKGKHRGYVEKIEQQVSVNPFLDLMKQATAQNEPESH